MRHGMRTAVWAVVAWSVGLGLWGPARARGDLGAEQVAAAIERGAAYLIRQQTADGVWSEWPNCESGTVALCTLALLNAGVSPDDPAVKKSLTYLRTRAP
ncbi:MAG TPA: hypothetical protein VGE52_04865, partial [Pirellulales bacterium]